MILYAPMLSQATAGGSQAMLREDIGCSLSEKMQPKGNLKILAPMGISPSVCKSIVCLGDGSGSAGRFPIQSMQSAALDKWS